MALTREASATVRLRLQSDTEFAQALLSEAVSLFVDGEPETCKQVLRDLVSATVGIEGMAEAVGLVPYQLENKLSASCSLGLNEISPILLALQDALQVRVKTDVVVRNNALVDYRLQPG